MRPLPNKMKLNFIFYHALIFLFFLFFFEGFSQKVDIPYQLPQYSRNIDIVKGDTVLLRNYVRFMFKSIDISDGNSYFIEIKDEMVNLLTIDPKITCPKEIEIIELNFKSEKSKVVVNINQEGNGYKIESEIKIHIKDSINAGQYYIEVSFPLIMTIAKEIGANRFKKTPTFIYTLTVYDSEEELPKTKLKNVNTKKPIELLEVEWQRIKKIPKINAIGYFLVCLVIFIICIVIFQKFNITTAHGGGPGCPIGCPLIIMVILSIILGIMTLIRILFIW